MRAAAAATPPPPPQGPAMGCAPSLHATPAWNLCRRRASPTPSPPSSSNHLLHTGKPPGPVAMGTKGQGHSVAMGTRRASCNPTGTPLALGVTLRGRAGLKSPLGPRGKDPPNWGLSSRWRGISPQTGEKFSERRDSYLTHFPKGIFTLGRRGFRAPPTDCDSSVAGTNTNQSTPSRPDALKADLEERLDTQVRRGPRFPLDLSGG